MIAKQSGQTNRSKDDTRGRPGIGGYFWGGSSGDWNLQKSSQTLRVWLCAPHNLRSSYCPIELATEENTLFELPPINRMVPTTSTRMTASITAYSAMSWPSSLVHKLRKVFVFIPSPF
jgi:hypothetical protein